MSKNIKSLLLPFYFGSVKEDERTLVERELLVDSEMLLDYLDLKRTIEKAELVPSAPSIAVWKNLRQKTSKRQRLIFSLGAAAALVLALSIFLLKQQPQESTSVTPVQNEMLFDSMSEPSSSSNVL